MMKQILFSLASLAVAAAFSTKSSPSMLLITRSTYDVPRARVSLQQSTENVAKAEEDTDDVTCYITNDEEIITEGEKPHVVCTSEPDDVSLQSNRRHISAHPAYIYACFHLLFHQLT